MNLFILLSCACNSNSSVLSLIFDGITAFGIVFAGIALFFSRRTECLTVMDKNTKEFRKIVRDEKANEIEEVGIKKATNSEIIRNDYLGLFNEQLFYIGKWYLPRQIALEWLTTIHRYIKKDENKCFSCITCKKNGDCKESEKTFYFERVNTFYKICEKVKEKEDKKKEEEKLKLEELITKIHKRYYRCPFSKCRRKRLMKKKNK